AVGIALTVEVALVDERHAPAERRNVGQHVRYGDGEAEVDERLSDATVADPEGPVAGRPGQDAAPWIDDAEIVDAGDVDAIADGRHEIVDGLRVASRHRDRKRERPVRLQRGGRRVSGRARVAARALCR